jgi:hypothetical protein
MFPCKEINMNDPQIECIYLNIETITITSGVLIKNLPFHTYEDLIFVTFLPIRGTSIPKMTGHVLEKISNVLLARNQQ